MIGTRVTEWEIRTGIPIGALGISGFTYRARFESPLTMPEIQVVVEWCDNNCHGGYTMMEAASRINGVIFINETDWTLFLTGFR